MRETNVIQNAVRWIVVSDERRKNIIRRRTSSGVGFSSDIRNLFNFVMDKCVEGDIYGERYQREERC